MVKQVIVMRKDLNMRKGKMIAQGAHAVMKALMQMAEWTDHDCIEIANIPTPMVSWLKNTFTKICVGCNSDTSLDIVITECEKLGVPYSEIVDNGITEFKGIPTRTCVAVGPDTIERVDSITGGFDLL